jgi:hypothetical protein
LPEDPKTFADPLSLPPQDKWDPIRGGNALASLGFEPKERIQRPLSSFFQAQGSIPASAFLLEMDHYENMPTKKLYSDINKLVHKE